MIDVSGEELPGWGITNFKLTKMPKKKNQHVIPDKGDWAVRGEGNSRNTINTKWKSDAVDKARNIAKHQKSELVIHDKKGRIIDKDSYGNDPHPPHDKKH